MPATVKTTTELLATANAAFIAADEHAAPTGRLTRLGFTRAQKACEDAGNLVGKIRLLAEMEEVATVRPDSIIAGHIGTARTSVEWAMTHCLTSGQPRTECRACDHSAAQIAALAS
ncbi:hypothetical protein ACFXPX_36695 [Kitasatospora sp. NPDC059146]|uniref:hypothetical protein n=1 Tax=unclassified Kitasatospora TaxID=2633591 RepID=UPI0036C9545F